MKSLLEEQKNRQKNLFILRERARIQTFDLRRDSFFTFLSFVKYIIASYRIIKTKLIVKSDNT